MTRQQLIMNTLGNAAHKVCLAALLMLVIHTQWYKFSPCTLGTCRKHAMIQSNLELRKELCMHLKFAVT